jgi:hypothetical protein
MAQQIAGSQRAAHACYQHRLSSFSVLREMFCEDAHDCTFDGAVTFKNIGRDPLDGISKANELRFTFGAKRAAFAV